MLKINNQNAYNGVSHLGLGFMRMGPDDSLNSKLIKQYIEAGGNYFETCRFYLDRKCEGIATNLLKPYNRKEQEQIIKTSLKNGYREFYPPKKEKSEKNDGTEYRRI